MTPIQSQTIHKSRLVNQFPIFYGWIILIVGTFGVIMTSPGQTYSVSIFLEHFINDLGISRSLVSTLYTIGTLIGSFILPIVGREIDRRGSRFMVVIVATIFGLACIYMGYVNNAIMLGLGFIAIRMFGQGSLTLISQNVINQWWVRRRGMVMGISGLAVAVFGFGGFPNIINWLIPIYGWRLTYIFLGLSLLFLMVPVGLLLFRNRPEEYGLQPDGGMHTPTSTDDTTTVSTEDNWTLAEVTRTPVFWVFSMGLASISMLSTGLFFHIVSIFQDNGLTPAIAASVFIPISITMAIVNLSSGILVDRIPVRLMMAVALLLQASVLIMALFLQSVQLAILYGIIVGTMSGLMRTVSSVVWANYFGRLHLGSITGVSVTVSIAASALGPMPFGIARDVLGSYNFALTVSAILPFLLGILSLFFDKPQRRS